MELKIDLENKCIRIDGTLYHLTEKKPLSEKELFDWFKSLGVRFEPQPSEPVKDYESVVKLFAKSMFYGKWKWETPNERVITMLMQELGLYPFKNEDEMIEKTQVDDGLFKRALTEVPIIQLNKKSYDRKAILTTEDGVEKFEGDTMFWFNNFFEPTPIKEITVDKNGEYKKHQQQDKYFHSKEKAEEYIANNKKSISYEELEKKFNEGIEEINRAATKEFDGWTMKGILRCGDMLKSLLEHFKPKS